MSNQDGNTKNIRRISKAKFSSGQSRSRLISSNTKNHFLYKNTIKIKGGINRKNIPFVQISLVFLLISVLLIIFIVIYSKNLPPQMPLYYGFPRGERQLVAPISLVIPVLISSLFITTNSILAYFIKNIFLKNAIVAGAQFGSVLTIITIVKILLINI